MSRIGAYSDAIEEGIIAFLLFAMVGLTFANVVLRYVFNSNLLWALEATVYLFAWMVLMGASYCVKKNLHIGVDLVVEHLPLGMRAGAHLVAILSCLLFSILLLLGAWNYWYPFISERAWLEVDDIPMPSILRFFEGWLNDGEVYEKMPRFIPYAVLPLSMGLLTLRFLQAGWDIVRGRRSGLIAVHEEESLENVGEG